MGNAEPHLLPTALRYEYSYLVLVITIIVNRKSAKKCSRPRDA